MTANGSLQIGLGRLIALTFLIVGVIAQAASITNSNALVALAMAVTELTNSSMVFVPRSEAFISVAKQKTPLGSTSVKESVPNSFMTSKNYLSTKAIVTKEKPIDQLNKEYFQVLNATNGTAIDKVLGKSNLQEETNNRANLDKGHNLTSQATILIGFLVLKWGLIVLVILVPLVLVPLLFLFIRGQSGDCEQTSAHELQQRNFESISSPIALFSTVPNRDPYLVDRSTWSSFIKFNEAVVDGEHPYYWLTPYNTVVLCQTGQLLHPSSGVLFSPIKEHTFDDNVGRNLKCQVYIDAEPNQVYDPLTRQLYERCLSLKFETNSQGQFEWSLPGSQSGVRRVTVDELPSSLAGPYNQLLNEQQRGIFKSAS